MSDEILVKCENVSKKFCRSLKRSLWYGVKDICSELNPLHNNRDIIGTKHFPRLREDEFWAVNGISFELKRGECLGLIGHNGAGKSTLLKLLYGLIKLDHGRITMKGRIGALIELNAGFNPILTGRENVYIYGSILGFSKKEIDEKYNDIVEFAELEEFMEMPFRSYSSGMKVRLGFAVAAQMEPDVLIIDEVLAVGDLGFRVKCFNAIGNMMQKSAVIFVTHSMPLVSRICTDLMLLESGSIQCHDNNISQGINNYLSRVNNSEPQISGSGKATVSNIHLSSNEDLLYNDNDILLLDYGDDLIIEMKLSLSSSAKQPGIRVIIWNQEFVPVAECNSEYNKFKIYPSKVSKVTLKFEKLHLKTGVYSIVIVVHNMINREVYMRFDNAAYFQIKFNYTILANFLLQGKWNQEILTKEV